MLGLQRTSETQPSTWRTDPGLLRLFALVPTFLLHHRLAFASLFTDDKTEAQKRAVMGVGGVKG